MGTSPSVLLNSKLLELSMVHVEIGSRPLQLAVEPPGVEAVLLRIVVRLGKLHRLDPLAVIPLADLEAAQSGPGSLGVLVHLVGRG